MPIFELDAGRPVLVQPMQPAAGTFPADTTSVVANHLGSLLGEPLFPVATRQRGTDGPHLLAVDAAGQPVVVEVVQLLDADSLVRALRFAGTASRMSSADLARAYHSGPERFATELVAFRENVPVAVAHSAARHGGVRLLLVCSEVSESLVDVVEFLRQSGQHVEVLQVGVLRGADGRRYVDVSPLVPQVPVRRAVEPSILYPLDDEGPSAGDDVGPEAGFAVRPPSGPEAGHDAGGASGGRGRRIAQPGLAGPPHGGGRRGEVRPTEHRRHSVAPSTDRSGAGARVAPESVATGPIPSAGAAAPAGTFPSVLPVPVGPAAAVLAPDPLLAAVAADLATTTTLVWSRQRRGQRFVATLRVDGLIQLPDGAVFAEPDDAAAAAVGSDYPVDGWRVWRMGDDGPTLADVRNS